MKITLITGMSATGKSTVITGLSALGYKAVDLEIDTSIKDQSVAGIILKHVWNNGASGIL